MAKKVFYTSDESLKKCHICALSRRLALVPVKVVNAPDYIKVGKDIFIYVLFRKLAFVPVKKSVSTKAGEKYVDAEQAT